MASINKHTDQNGNTSFRVRVRLKGYPIQTASFNRLTDAKKWASSTESAIREGRHFKTSEAKRHTFADAIDKYKSNILPIRFSTKEQRNRRSILAWWRNDIGHYLLSDLTPAIFSESRDKLTKTPSKSRKGNKLSPDTIKRYFLVANNILKACINEWAWLEQSPLRDGRVELPSLPSGRVRFLDDDERNKLLTACKNSDQEWLYLGVILAISTGMRQSELMNLYWKTPSRIPTETAWGVVHLDQSAIILHSTKNGSKRRVPLASLALILLQEHNKIRQLDANLLFPSSINPQKPLSFKRSWATALKHAEINDFKWHDLRHCTASYLAMNGASLAEIAEVLGHKTLQMVKRYAHLSDGHVSSVVESMNNKLFGS